MITTSVVVVVVVINGILNAIGTNNTVAPTRFAGVNRRSCSGECEMQIADG